MSARSTDVEFAAFRQATRRAANVDWRLVAAGFSAAGAIVAFGLGWLGVSGTAVLHDQLSYFLSGGATGLALLTIGLALYLDYEHASDRKGLALLFERIDELEESLAREDRSTEASVAEALERQRRLLVEEDLPHLVKSLVPAVPKKSTGSRSRSKAASKQ